MSVTEHSADPQAGAKAFEGDIAALPIPELLQFIHISGRDGVLVISEQNGKPRAVIHYRDAAIVHAVCDGIVGREAVFAAIAFTSGHFEYFAGKASRIEQTVDDNVQNLILEGLRRFDELSHFASILPGDDEPLFVAPEPPHDDIRLTAREWRILSLVNGKRTLGEIIAASGREAAEVRLILVGLLTADLVVDRRDDSYLDAIVVRHLSQDEVGSARQAPPTFAGNLLLRACDGRATARQLIATLRIDERQLFRELELLVGTRWIGFVTGEELFRRRILE